MKYLFEFYELPKLVVPNNLFDVRFVHTDNIIVAFNELKAGAKVPGHQHVHDCTTSPLLVR